MKSKRGRRITVGLVLAFCMTFAASPAYADGAAVGQAANEDSKATFNDWDNYYEQQPDCAWWKIWGC